MAKFKKGEIHTQDSSELMASGNVKYKAGWKTSALYSILLFIFSFLIYSNTLEHGYALDDDVVFLKNEFVQQGTDSISDIFSHGFLYGFNKRNNQSYRPVVSTAFALEVEFFGSDPHVGHMLNVILYSLGIVLLFFTMKLVFQGYNLLIPLLITIIYAAHPIHTEVVANIKGRDDMLTFVFMILSFNLLFQFLRRKNSVFLVLGVPTYFICLLTKENAVAIMAIFPLLIYFFTNADLKKALITSVPYGAVVILYLLMRNSVLDTVAFGEELNVINNGLMAAETKSEMLATNFVILGKYLWLLIYPHPLSFDYSFSQFPIVNWTNIYAIGSLLMYIAIGLFALKTFKQKNVISFGILFYLITFSVTSNLFIKIGCTLGERFLFIPSLGYCIALVFLLLKLLKIDGTKSELSIPAFLEFKPAMLLVGLVVVVVTAFSYKTYSRNFDWESNLTLFRADIDATPGSARTHFSLGSALNTDSEQETDPEKKKAMLIEAIEELGKSVAIHPEFSAAYYNMGVAYFSYGDQNNALIAYNNCLKYTPTDKQALNNMGVIYFNNKQYDQALEHFFRAVGTNPDFPDPYANIGAVYHNQGKYQDAITYYDKALAFNPNNRMVMGNLVKLYNSMGDTEKSNYYSKLLN